MYPPEPATAATPIVKLTRRTDYAPWPFSIEGIVDLHFELAAERTVVRSRIVLQRRPDAPADAPLRLDGRGLTLVSLHADGFALPGERYEQDDDGLTITGLPATTILEIVNTIEPRTNLSGAGLFELHGVLVTQCEPQGLRLVTFCPDRPDVLARYRITMVADAARYPLLLSNGNRIASRDLGDGRHEAVWDDPFPKPSYIFALVAGDLACLKDEHMTPSGRRVRISLYAEARYIERCRFAMEALKRSMRWDEATYGLECDLDDYQVVAPSGFGGAMENKGLNLFDISGILADPEITTDDEALTIERIIAHEYFHNWTGNRVTCRDWFQLSLKEGLTRFRDQSYIEDLLGGGTYRIDSVRQLQRNQFNEDDGPDRHPVRPDTYADVEQFYTPTVYDKGAELIRMMRTLLGSAAYHDGVALYLRTHDGQAVTTDDFVVAMERASGRDLGPFRRWYTQAGRPRLRVEQQHDAAAQRYTLTLSQHLPGEAAAQPFHIPVALQLFGADGAPLTDVHRADGGDPCLIELVDARQSFMFENVAQPPLPSLLEGLSAPVSIEDFLSDDQLAVLMARATDPYARWNAGQTLLLRLIRRLAAVHHAGGTMELPEAIAHAFAAVLANAASNRMVAAELLRIPDEPVLSEGLALIDLDGHAAARDFVRAALARRLRPQLTECLNLPASTSRALLDVDAMGRRRLAAASLHLLMAIGDDAIADVCEAQVSKGATMSDRFAALSAIVDHVGPQRARSLAAFCERWKDQPTVVNKWFSAQALSRLAGTAERVIELESHPLFSMTDVPRMMALYGSFFRQNRIAFHDPSGRGYELLADRLLQSDTMGRGQLNWLLPQITPWRRHEPKRRALMRAQLERIFRTPGISNGLKGLMQRALDEPSQES